MILPTLNPSLRLHTPSRRRKPSKLPSIHITTKEHLFKTYLSVAALLIATICLIGLAINLNSMYNVKQTEAVLAETQLTDCLNGVWRAKADDGSEIGCMRAVTN